MKTGSQTRSTKKMLRKYPALGLMIAAGALAVLLPSALTVPQSGPSTLAEFAPVPGSGQGSSDLSDVGQASSGGLGFGSGSGASRSGIGDEIGAPKQGKAKLKRCVGSPPRQTEDLLSPPCVAFFDGDNGGATSKGVTKDEVSVVLFATARTGDDATFVDCFDGPAATDRPDDVICKAYARFFNNRFQTYNRVVHIWLFHPATGASGVVIDAEVGRANDQKRPFAINTASAQSEFFIARAAATRQIVGVQYSATSRFNYTKFAPYIIGFRMDLEDRAATAASYICTKLARRVARFSGTEGDRLKPRKFGYIAAANSPYRAALDAELKEACDLVISSSSNPTSPTNAQVEMAKLKADEVTTVIVANEWSQNAAAGATANAWFPEWFIPGFSEPNAADTNSEARGHRPPQWNSAFGLTLDYRRDEVPNQPWYRAYKEGCPVCPEPSDAAAAFVYDSFNMLFWGLQAAGPRLTPESLDKGLHAIPARGSPDPYKPAAYFAPGNYSFIKDAMEIWWDSQGQAPGDPALGCYRLPNGGRRFRAGEWLPGDDDIQKVGVPCQGSTRL